MKNKENSNSQINMHQDDPKLIFGAICKHHARTLGREPGGTQT